MDIGKFINLFDECLEILPNKCLKTQSSTNLLCQWTWRLR